MASAGRILIMPKGDYDSSVTYEILDLVFYEGISWLAKKTVVGIVPSEENTEYWHKLCEAIDLTNIKNRIKALEDEDVRLEIVTHEGTNTYGASNSCSVTCKTAPRLLIYVGYNSNVNETTQVQESATSLGMLYTQNLIICDFLTTEYKQNFGFAESNASEIIPRYAKKSEDGKTISWYVEGENLTSQHQLNGSDKTYYFLAIS